jgi:hypothetical protein
MEVKNFPLQISDLCHDVFTSSVVSDDHREERLSPSTRSIKIYSAPTGLSDVAEYVKTFGIGGLRTTRKNSIVATSLAVV